jgi:hypothetical protein
MGAAVRVSHRGGRRPRAKELSMTPAQRATGAIYAVLLLALAYLVIVVL